MIRLPMSQLRGFIIFQTMVRIPIKPTIIAHMTSLHLALKGKPSRVVDYRAGSRRSTAMQPR